MKRRKPARVAAILLACAAVLAAPVLFVDFNSLKPRIEAAVTEALGLPVRIRGDIRLGFVGVRPAAALHDVSIGPDIRAEAVDLSFHDLHFSQHILAQAERLSYAGTLLGDYDIPVDILPGGVEIKPLSGKRQGARIAGEVRYAGRNLHIVLSAGDVPWSDLLPAAKGKVAVHLDVAGTGDDYAHIVRTLKGRFTLTSGPGELTSEAVNFWARGLLTTLLPGRRAETKLNCAVADFAIDRGIATSRMLVADTDEISVLGSGSVNLYDQTIDILLKPKSKNLDPVNLTAPVRVTGPAQRPVVTPEPRDMAKKLGGILLGVVNPAFMLMPVIQEKMGGDYNAACMKVLKEGPQP